MSNFISIIGTGLMRIKAAVTGEWKWKLLYNIMGYTLHMPTVSGKRFGLIYFLDS